MGEEKYEWVTSDYWWDFRNPVGTDPKKNITKEAVILAFTHSSVGRLHFDFEIKEFEFIDDGRTIKFFADRPLDLNKYMLVLQLDNSLNVQEVINYFVSKTRRLQQW